MPAVVTPPTGLGPVTSSPISQSPLGGDEPSSNFAGRLRRLAFSHQQLAVFALTFALVGTYLLWHSLAISGTLKYGDINGDHIVNGADLSILLFHFGQSDPPSDINGDGIISGADVSILLSYFGSQVPPLSTDTEVGFDSEAFTCDRARVQIDKTFSLSYGGCRDQIAQQVQFLAQNSVRAIRIWPMVGQFFVHEPRSTGNISYDNQLNSQYIANLDDFLNLLKQNKMQAMVGLSTSGLDTCQGDDQVRFNWNILNDSNLRSQYLNGLKLFLDHYKNNTTIKSYDLMNEVNLVVGSLLRGSWERCGLPVADANTKQTILHDLFQQLYSAAKNSDPNHLFSYSFASNASLSGADLKSQYGAVQDYYDIHAYVPPSNCSDIPQCANTVKKQGKDYKDPKDWYDKTFTGFGFPPIDKSMMVQGETGVNASFSFDLAGAPCEQPVTSQSFSGQMNDFCQQIYVITARQFMAEANTRGAKQVYFHGLWEHNTYAWVNYDSQNKPTGFSASPAAQAIFDYDRVYYATR